MKKAVRMADIAQQLGISTVSVSKALAGKPGVSAEMRAKVVALARQMGYDQVRDRRESGPTGNIGVLVSDRNFSGDAYYASLYRELVLKSKAEGLSCIIEIVPQDAEQSGEPSYLVTGNRVDGIIFMGELNRTYLAATADAGLPCLLVDFHIPGLQLDYVVRSSEDGGFLLTQHLLSAGYRRIGFLGNPAHSVNDMFRYLGYQRALREAGIKPPEAWLWEVPDRMPDPLISCVDIPEAFVCVGSKAVAELFRLLPSASIADAALACFGDDTSFNYLKMPSAIYQIGTSEIAEVAVRQLARRIRGEKGISVGYIVTGRLILDEPLGSVF